MALRFNKKALALFSLPLMLSACEGYEMQLTDTHFPYGNERTAGSGVIYVRAKMMPEKTLQLQPVQRDMQARPIEGDNMGEVFRESQRK
jgi:hypothetical protein